MSLILDALRKMEQERKSRRGAAKELRPEVLRYRGAAEPQPHARPYLLVAVGLALLVAGIGAGVLLRGDHGGKPSQPAAEALPMAAAPTVATAAAPAAVVPRFEPAAPPAPTAPAAPAPAATTITKAPVPAVIEPSAAPEVSDDAEAAPTAPVPAPKSSRSSRNRKRQEAKPATMSESPRTTTVTQGGAVNAQAPGDIKLSGIAWQDERQMRRAVLNGSLVGEGAMVAGARVVEIKENKVRLSRGGQHFEIALSAAISTR